MTIRVKIEIPRDCKVKYEINKDTGLVEVDRILKVKYPFNYGYIPKTLWYDGDALDAIVIGDYSLHPGVELEAEPLGVVEMYDNGESDYKVICRLAGTEDKPEDYQTIIKGFLKSYKEGVDIKNFVYDMESIQKVLAEAASLGYES